MTTYSYTKTPVCVDRLTLEIRSSTIVTALDHISLLGEALDINFKADLSASDKTTLDALVVAHAGQPLVEDVPAPVVVTNTPVVTTQYELNDKDLKLARAHGDIDPATKTAIVALQVPGAFGSGAGRYVAGGYAISADYDRDDYVTVRIEDTDRYIAQTVQSIAGLATMPTDAEIQAMGVLPGIGEAFPSYPVVKSYTDDELPEANRGWFFWANAIGNNEQANGECEVEPIGGYGFLPAGFYIVMTYVRATKTTGSLRVNFYWGKIGLQ